MSQPQSGGSPPKTQTQQKLFRILNMTFASRKIFIEFLMSSFLIIVIPIVSVVLLNNWAQNEPTLSSLAKVVIAVGPAVIFINIVMCCYVYKAIKDPQNYKVDPPLKIKMR